MSFINESFNIGKKNMVVGNGKEDFNISSINGHEVRINGIIPGAGGGGGVPPVGDVSFIGDLNVNNSGPTGTVGKIYFQGDDLYKDYAVNPGDPVVPPVSYVVYKQLAEKNETNTFIEVNTFKEDVKIQGLSDDPVPVFEDKIKLNKNGNIECNEINNDTEIKSNSVICENGAPEDQLVKARQYHFRPLSTETTGWVFSQKQADNPSIPEDNYLMLQNTQATGSLNLVKSSFDPENPTSFDIVLDPQNGQVKTATSFDAPQVNFRMNAVDNWSISQPPSGDPAEGTLIARCPTTTGQFNIFDSASSPWAQFSHLATTLPKATTINNTLNVNGNVTLGSTNDLLFGAYSFRPIQYVYSKTIEIRGTPDNTGYTNMVFNCLGQDQQPTLGGRNLWTNVNTGATNVDLYNNTLEGFYKCSIKQTADSSSVNFKGTEIIFDYILAASVQDTPDLTPYISYGYNKFPADRAGPPALSTVASVLIDHKNSLSSQSQPVFLTFSDPPVVGPTFETMTVQIKLTKLDF